MRLSVPRTLRQEQPVPPDEARRRLERDALREIAHLLADRSELDELLRKILDRAAAIVDSDDGFLYLADAEGSRPSMRAGTGAFADHVGKPLDGSDPVSDWVLRTGESWSRGDLSPRIEAAPRSGERPSYVVAPIAGRAAVMGAIGFADPSGARSFAEQDASLLEQLGRLASIALENTRLHESALGELEQRRQTEEELLHTVARLSRSELELRLAHEETIRRLADAAEFRDAETGRHTERMSRYCALLGASLGLDDDHCDRLRVASALHDVGKIAVPDVILLKPGPLTPEERIEMQRHAEIGYRLLSGSSSDLLDLAASIAWTHHERFDGNGYPRGLADDNIPLEGRIAAVADVFDALTSERAYRAAMPPEEAIALMREGRGTQFDPDFLDVFLESVDETKAIMDEVRSDASSLDLDLALALAAPQPLAPAGDGEDSLPSTKPIESISGRLIKRAGRSATRALTRGAGRDSIERALDALHDDSGKRLLLSVYTVEHDRLWLVSQRGHHDIRDGFSLDQGVMGRAARTGKTQIAGDLRSDPDFLAVGGGSICAAAIPLHVDGRIVGVLNIETIDRLLPKETGQALGSFAETLAPRVEEFCSDLGTQVGELVRLCIHASSLRGIPTIGEFATRTIGRMLQLESAQLDLRPDDGPRLASFWRQNDTAVEPITPDDLERLGDGEAAGSGIAYGIVDAQAAGVSDPATRWVVFLPLRVCGTTMGIITGRLKSGDPPAERLEAATLFAQHTAALIDVAYALRREQHAAAIDALTGLLNRRGFDQRLDEELRRSVRADRPMALILCDCDGLKTINDLRGHEHGDALLQLVASCLRTNKRTSDMAARYGGDEFALILPDADIETALAVAERVRGAISAETISGFRPSGSFGVAAFPNHGRTADELLRHADSALYEAKRLGGDEVSTTSR